MARRPGVAKLQDVAKAAGVSVTTVSRHLNGALPLPADTVQRIRDAIGLLNYRPNPHARSLGRGRTDTIGLVVPDIANPFFAQLAGAIEAAADAHGLGLVLYVTLNRPGRELDYLERLRRAHVDGLIFVTNHGDGAALADSINRDSHGVVLVDEDIAGTAVPKVFCDNAQGGYLATRHLIEAGHRQIAFLGGPPGMISTAERLAGCRRAVAEAGPGAAITVECLRDYTIEHGRVAAERLLAEPAGTTAVFAASDEIVVGLLEGVRRHGVAVPRDLSIVAFDDVGPLHLFDPPLTAVRQPVAEMGRRGVEIVLSQVRAAHGVSQVRAAHGRDPGEGQAVGGWVERLPVELVVRASVTAPASTGRARRPAFSRRT